MCHEERQAQCQYVPSIDNSFVFDRVFGVDAAQKEVYDYAAKPIINGVLRGFNGTVFAYGQTASGKTHTMEGPDIEDEVQMGVIPRMVWSIFDGIDHAADYIEFLVKVSIVEIYNERIRDLLDPKKDNLKIHEDKARGVFIGEVTETYVGSEQEIFDIMKAGKYNRAVAETNLNEHSSRSHLIFMLTIEQKNLHDRSVKAAYERSSDAELRGFRMVDQFRGVGAQKRQMNKHVGKLHLVDLAGSEKVAKTGASGERLDEAKNINRSLSALGNVINALTDRKSNHVPYRDSKLSRVLQESLGGNAKTSLIITCSPSYFNEQETVSTLRFGQRAKMIKNVVKVNHERSVEELKLLLQRRDQALSELRSRVSTLEQLLRSNGITVPEDKSSAVFLPAGTLGAPTPVDEAQSAELEEQLQANREKEELQSQLRDAEDDMRRLTMQAMDAQNDRESMEYERNEQVSELQKLRNDNKRQAEELEELVKSHQNLIQSTAADTPTSKGSSRLRKEAAAVDEDKDPERPLKRKVSQLDKNLEQLTVMYHKLVAQNSGLKVEVAESDKKIERKDQRIQQLERNLREAKQKYEKLLTQCANLTAMIDVGFKKIHAVGVVHCLLFGLAGAKAEVLPRLPALPRIKSREGVRARHQEIVLWSLFSFFRSDRRACSDDMASLFEGLQTQVAEPPQKDVDSSGSGLFGSLSVAGEGTSAFSFLNSDTQQEPVPSSQTPVVPAESIFTFVNSADVADPVATSAYPTGGTSGGESSPSLGDNSAFSFIGGSQESVSRDREVAGALDVPEGTRRKTRKALLPGHASRPQEETRMPLPTPTVDELAIERKPFEGVVPVSEAVAQAPQVQAAAQETQPQLQAKPPPPPDPSPSPFDFAEQGRQEDSKAPFAGVGVAELQQRLETAEAELQRLCDNEQFEEAEALDCTIQALKEMIAKEESTEAAAVSAPAPTVEHKAEALPVAEGPRKAQATQAVQAVQAAVPETQAKPPPPPEPAPSPQEKLRRAFNAAGVRQWLEEQLDESDKEQQRLLEAQASCLSASQRTADSIAELRQHLTKTEADQNQLCDNEQFEEADALDCTIQGLKDDISKELEEVAIGAKKMVTFAESLLSLTRSRISVANDALDRAEVLRKEGAEGFQVTEERCLRHLQAEEARIEAERKRMDLAQSHIEKDSQNLKEEWQQVTEAIDQQTTEDTAEREKASHERAALDEEIQELERQLSQKLEQRKTLSEVIDSCDLRISCIRAKFEKQLGRLEGKQKRLEEAQKEVEVDTQQVCQMEAELQKEREALREQELQHQQQMQDVRRASRDLRKQRSFLSGIIQRRVVWQRLMEPHRESLREARQSWEEATQKCMELSTNSAGQEAAAAKLRSQVDATVEILPSLEAEKKLAVASRSFKEAGRLTEEIRRREEGKKKIETELESLQASLATAREELAACRQTEQNAQEELLKVEGTCAVEELRVLRHQVSDLEDLCKSPSLSASARRLYNQEVSVLKHQQAHLAKKYNIETESLEDIAAETIEGLQDGEVQKETADSMSEAEADYSCSPVPNGSSELPGTQPTALSEDEVRQDDVQEVTSEDCSPEALSERAAAVASAIEDFKAELESLEPEIERACEVEDFDLAEELESQRKTLTQKLEDAVQELATLRRKLDENGSVEKEEPAQEEDTPEELEEKREKAEVQEDGTEEPRSEVQE
ncbi:unnamed protein product [Symbiodinium microadriaticum]|nr:unnamed protein product [Symbiodinium microadriaticum]